MKMTFRTLKTYAVLAFAISFANTVAAQTPSLEFAAGAGNPTGNGITASSQVITFQANNNNPTNSSFSNFSPTITATFSVSNQQYTLPTSQISSGVGLSFGGNLSNSSSTATVSPLFNLMNVISTPSNSHFTSAVGITAGTGIDITANKAVEFFTSARALYNASASTSGRYYFADLTITFSQGVTNPILHVVGLGGYYSQLGFTAELEMQTTGVVLSKLSGSSELTISGGTKILNSSSEPNSPTGSGAASGSILASGTNITSLVFRVYMRGDGDESTWGSSNMHAGDVWLMGISMNAPVNISGNVYDDADGLTNNKVDGTGNGKPSSTQMYANLLDTAGKVLGTTAVAANGSYSFNNVGSNTTYKVQISKNQGTNGSPAPSVANPTNWINTGEYIGNGSGNDGTTDGILVVAVGNSNVTNVNFGIEQIPVSDVKWYAIATPAVNSSRTLNGSGLLPGALSGSDAEDGTLGASGKVGITSLPTNGNELWYNGVKITKGADGLTAPSVSNPYIIASYNVGLLAVKFTGVNSTSTVFNYAFYDAASQKSTAATYTITWANLLPVKLTSFTAALVGNKVELNWTSATESELSHYVIEKSTDGTNFSEAGVVFAAGNSTEKIDYRFVDDKINTNSTGVYYYRLRTVDIDGKYSYSEVRVIRIGSQDNRAINVVAYPNPAVSNVNVTIPASWQGKKVNYILFANSGQVVFSNEAASAGQTETINLSKLAPGMYIIKVSCQGETAQQKIVKQ